MLIVSLSHCITHACSVRPRTETTLCEGCALGVHFLGKILFLFLPPSFVLTVFRPVPLCVCVCVRILTANEEHSVSFFALLPSGSDCVYPRPESPWHGCCSMQALTLLVSPSSVPYVPFCLCSLGIVAHLVSLSLSCLSPSITHTANCVLWFPLRHS